MPSTGVRDDGGQSREFNLRGLGLEGTASSGRLLDTINPIVDCRDQVIGLIGGDISFLDPLRYFLLQIFQEGDCYLSLPAGKLKGCRADGACG